jgi:uncharacterized repeat protein (TIGR01451 family)
VFKGSADLSLTKVASSTTPTVGGTVTYTLTVTNAGPATATGVRVAGVLPAGVTYVAGSITGGTARNAAGAATLTWDQATLASGASAALTYQATVKAPTGAANEYRNARRCSRVHCSARGCKHRTQGVSPWRFPQPEYGGR